MIHLFFSFCSWVGNCLFVLCPLSFYLVFLFDFLIVLFYFSQNQRTPLYIASENTRQDVVALLWTNNISFESREMVGISFSIINHP